MIFEDKEETQQLYAKPKQGRSSHKFGYTPPVPKRIPTLTPLEVALIRERQMHTQEGKAIWNLLGAMYNPALYELNQEQLIQAIQTAHSGSECNCLSTDTELRSKAVFDEIKRRKAKDMK